MKLFTFFLFLIVSIPAAHAIDEKSPQGYFVLFSESGSTISHYGCFLDENNKSKLRCDVQDLYIDKGEGEDFSQVRSNPEFKKMFDEAGSFKDEYADEFQGAIGQMCPLIPIWNKIVTDPSGLNVDSLIREFDKARFPDFDEDEIRTAINKFIRKPQAEKNYDIRIFNTFSKFCDGGGTDADAMIAMMEMENEKTKKTCSFLFKSYVEEYEKVNDDLWLSEQRTSQLGGCEVIGLTRLYRSRDKETIIPVWEMSHQTIPIDDRAEDSFGGTCKDRATLDVYVSQYGLRNPKYLGCEFIK